jgi:hypothetical protein
VHRAEHFHFVRLDAVLSGLHVAVELELDLIHAHMAQKQVLRDEVGARALRVRSLSREGAWASAGVQGAWVSGCGCEAD